MESLALLTVAHRLDSELVLALEDEEDKGAGSFKVSATGLSWCSCSSPEEESELSNETFLFLFRVRRFFVGCGGPMRCEFGWYAIQFISAPEIGKHVPFPPVIRPAYVSIFHHYIIATH